MNFPTVLNIELTNICNKNCHMCGRRKRERKDPSFYKKYSKNMPFETVEKIASQIKDKGILIQFHWDGDPMVYPRLGDALKLFEGNIRCFDTNGKLLVEKADEIIDNMESLTLSTFEDDPERPEQWATLQDFLVTKGERKPNVVIRVLGDTPRGWLKLYEDSGLLNAHRVLHKPEGSFGYKKPPVVPEHGICLEALMHPAIDVNGDMSICVRYDPEKTGVLGNVNEQTIEEIWNGEKRKEFLQNHIEGKRHKHPLCSKCEFWGVPRG